VPSFVHWNDDGIRDLIVGEKTGVTTARVRVYLNVGTPAQPQFSAYSYAQSNGADLVCAAGGCLGCFPRVVYWDTDDRKDLLVGLADGRVMVFLNTGTEASPTFDGGTLVQVGTAGSVANLDAGARATPSLVDWDNDGDNDVDGEDLEILVGCATGPELGLMVDACTAGDFDEDGDVDQTDFGYFQRFWTGAR